MRRSASFEVGLESCFKFCNTDLNLWWNFFWIRSPGWTADVRLFGIPRITSKAEVKELNFGVQDVKEAMKDGGHLNLASGEVWRWTEFQTKAKQGTEVFWRGVGFTQIMTRRIGDARRQE